MIHILKIIEKRFVSHYLGNADKILLAKLWLHELKQFFIRSQTSRNLVIGIFSVQSNQK
jgi:hypothetical protein